jgi:hypothetical protein
MPTIDVRCLWDGTAARAGEAVRLHLTFDGPDLVIEVDAPFHGDPLPVGPPGPTAGLWAFEVVELFLVGQDASPRYTEIELGPAGHHLVLQLCGVRKPLRTGLDIAFTAVVEGARWRGRAVVPGGLLPPSLGSWNAYAIHGQGAQRRYLAAHPVPGDAPDFHRLEHFAPWLG